MRIRLVGLLAAALVTFIAPAYGEVSPNGIFRDLSAPGRAALNLPATVGGASRYRLVSVDREALDQVLSRAMSKGAGEMTVSIPLPDGGFQEFRLRPNRNVSPQLAALDPDYLSVTGVATDGSPRQLVLSSSDIGVHGAVLGDGGSVFVQPIDEMKEASVGRGEDVLLVYSSRDSVSQPFQCGTSSLSDAFRPDITLPASDAWGAQVRRLRLAIMTTGELTNAVGGASSDSSIKKKRVREYVRSLVDLVGQIDLRDLGVSLELVYVGPYLDPATDPYSNPDDSSISGMGKTASENQVAMDGPNGPDPASYDVGHLLHRSSSTFGIVGNFGIVCKANRGNAVSGIVPEDSFASARVVTHELGHQLGAHHTFSSGGGCSNVDFDVEPGSGSTVMAYPGRCGFQQNLRVPNDDKTPTNGDLVFHVQSLYEIRSFLSATPGPPCGTTLAGPLPPASTPVTAGTYKIPVKTPFELQGGGSRTGLLYSWEQDNPGSAFFRSFDTTASKNRVFPQLRHILQNQNVPPVIGERLPEAPGTLKFYLTVRDAMIGAAYSSMSVEFVGQSAFSVTSPNTNVYWQSGTQKTVTWDVAGSDQPPVSCAKVNILLSTDGGSTFPTSLAAAVNNTGSATVTVPTVTSTVTRARVKVACAASIFFDIGDVDFTIGTSPTPPGGGGAGGGGGALPDVHVNYYPLSCSPPGTITSAVEVLCAGGNPAANSTQNSVATQGSMETGVTGSAFRCGGVWIATPQSWSSLSFLGVTDGSSDLILSTLSPSGLASGYRVLRQLTGGARQTTTRWWLDLTTGQAGGSYQFANKIRISHPICSQVQKTTSVLELRGSVVPALGYAPASTDCYALTHRAPLMEPVTDLAAPLSIRVVDPRTLRSWPSPTPSDAAAAADAISAVGTDGSAVGLVVLTADSGQPVDLRLCKTGCVNGVVTDTALGGLLPMSAFSTTGSVQQLPAGPTIQVTPTLVDGKWVALALYRAPAFLPLDPAAPGIRSPVQVAIGAVRGTATAEKTVVLMAPPIVLVGDELVSSPVGSSIGDYLGSSMGAPRFHLVSSPVLPGCFSDCGLAQAQVAREIDTALQSAAADGLLVSQVDVVTHGRHGLCVRALSGAADFRRPENYSQGAVRRLVTLGAPHGGSPLASWIGEHLLDPARTGSLWAVLGFDDRLGDLLRSGPEDLAASCLDSQSPGSPELGGLPTATAFPFLSVAGTVSSTGCSGLPCLVRSLVRSYGASGDSLESLLGTSHDGVVGESSQSTGATASVSVTGVSHTALSASEPSEGSDERVFAQVACMLNTGAVCASSRPEPAVVDTPAVTTPIWDLDFSALTEVSSTSLTLGPATSTPLTAFEPVTFTTSAPGLTISRLVLYLGGEVRDVTAGPFSTTYTPRAPGFLEVRAVAIFSNGSYAKVRVGYSVALPLDFLGVQVTPGNLAFFKVGDSAKVRVWALYGKGRVDVTGRAALSVEGERNDVVTVDQEATLTAHGNGVATVTAFFEGATAAVPVQVTAPFRYGDLDESGGADVVDLVILASTIVGNVTVGQAPYRSQFLSGDVKKDGVLDVFDIVTLAGYIVGNVASLPVY